MQKRIEKLKENPKLREFDVIGIYRDEGAYKPVASSHSTFEQNLSKIAKKPCVLVKEEGEIMAIFFDKNLLEDEEFMEKLQSILDSYSSTSAIIRMHKLA